MHVISHITPRLSEISLTYFQRLQNSNHRVDFSRETLRLVTYELKKEIKTFQIMNV